MFGFKSNDIGKNKNKWEEKRGIYLTTQYLMLRD